MTYFDERRDIIVPGDQAATISYATKHFIQCAQKAITDRGRFFVALSGGSTPKAMYQSLSSPKNRDMIDWSKVWLFWGDERAVPPNDPQSNYHMAMEAGFKQLPLKKEQIFRMEAEKDIEQNALVYEQLIRKNVPNEQFDLVMLGMGDDGHTASLFPMTHGLQVTNRLVIANYNPTLKVWRMSLTFDCINKALLSVFYVLGATKAETVSKVLNGEYEPDILPSQRIGTPEHKALWILDTEAAQKLL